MGHLFITGLKIYLGYQAVVLVGGLIIGGIALTILAIIAIILALKGKSL